MKSNTKELWVKTMVATEKGYKKKEKTSQKVRFKRSFIINDGNFTSSPPVLSLLPSPLAIRRLKGQPITPRALHAVLLMKSGGRKVCERACMCVFFGMKRANGSRLIMRAGEHTLAGALHRRYLCKDHISKRPCPLCLCISSPAIYHSSSPGRKDFSLPAPHLFTALFFSPPLRFGHQIARCRSSFCLSSSFSAVFIFSCVSVSTFKRRLDRM